EGVLHTRGRIAALLELGTGFNPEFTGRENIRLGASLLGLDPDTIEARIPDIAHFADIGHFFDYPVKLYSSGMHARLAFALVAHVDADLLIVDEALAVGDAA
ncbi:ABC transporter ATP-binding protein, partial [Ferrovum myxofaciens]